MKFLNKISKLFHKSFINAYFYLFAASAVGLSILLVVYASGLEILQILLRTSLGHYFFEFFIISGTLIVALILLAVRTAIKRIPSPPSLAWVKIALFIPVMAICLASGAYFFKFELHFRGKGPSAARHLWARIGPVLQLGPVKDHRAGGTDIVIWYFDPVGKTGPAEIKLGSEPSLTSMRRVREAAGTDGKRHEFHLSGLRPQTRYYYRIPDWGDKTYSFKSPPVENSAGPIRFTCLGDTGNTHKGGYGFSYYHDILQTAKKFYEDRGIERSFIIHAGDAVRTGDDLDAWHQHFTSRDYGSLPIVPAPGNHAFLNDGGDNYRYLYGQPDYYSLDYAGVHVLSIHSFDGPGTSLDGPLLSTGAEQYRFIKDDLARSAEKKWVIVIIHIPILTTGDYPPNEILAAQYFELFRKFKVDLVISGHNHDFGIYHVDRKADWGGTIYLVTGTGGSSLDSFIMTRRWRRWKTWFHDPHSSLGLYQHDRYTERYYEYGELSWGFTDVEIRDDRMIVSYYRWLDFERFLKITGQNSSSWDMTPIDERTWRLHNLSNVALVKKVIKVSRKKSLLLGTYFRKKRRYVKSVPINPDGPLP